MEKAVTDNEIEEKERLAKEFKGLFLLLGESSKIFFEERYIENVANHYQLKESYQLPASQIEENLTNFANIIDRLKQLAEKLEM
jgi:UDP-N-acetylmuramoylalanine-D-glutamate ligase